MNHLHVRAQMTISDLMTRWRETIPVFLLHRMACVGCPMAPFETLENVAAVYGLKLDAFLDELDQAISTGEQDA